MKSARQLLLDSLREQLGGGTLAVLAFTLGALATAALAALAGPLLATLDHPSFVASRAAPGAAGWPALAPERLALAVAALMVLRALGRYAGTRAAGAVQQRAVRNLRIQLHDHLLDLAPSAWARLAPGELASRLGAEVAAVRSLVHLVISHTLQHLLMATALASVAIHLDTRVATSALALAAPLAVVAWWLSRAARPSTLAVHVAEARVAELAGEHGTLVPLVRAYGAEDYARAQLRDAAEASERAVLSALDTQQRVGPALEGLAALFGVAALLLLPSGARGLPFATGVSLFAALLLLVRPLQALASALPAAYAGLASLERLDAFLELPHLQHGAAEGVDAPPPRAARDAPPQGPATEALALEGVSFSYRAGVSVLEDVSLSVRAGERVALVGRSGEGKSTLLMLLAGLLPPSAGTRRVDGVARAGVASHIAWVPQDSLVFADTLLANVAFGAPRDPQRARRALTQVGLDELLRALPEGLDTLLAGRGRQLSGGERQRLALARALYRDPRILLLDEVTASLDAESEAEVLSALAGLAREGVALVFVSHRPSVAAFADRVVRLDAGRIVSDRAS